MSDALFRNYERELLFIRQMAQEFARSYPATAGRLLLEPNRSNDPHVERLIEAFALLAGRVHQKIEDEFPELTDALLGVLYPHYLAPVPSMTILEFVLDEEQGDFAEGFLIPRGSRLYVPMADLTAGRELTPCRYRTGADVRLYPIKVAEARVVPPPFPPVPGTTGPSVPESARALLRIRLETLAGATFSGLTLDTLRLFLSGENLTVAALYEVLFNHTVQVVLAESSPGPPDTGGPVSPLWPPPPIRIGPSECLRPVGLNPEEALIPAPPGSFPGYLLLTEFFAFPAKFLFFDLCGFSALQGQAFGTSLDILIYLDHLPANLAQEVSASTFRLHATTAINLFEQVAEPIIDAKTKFEHTVTPDITDVSGLEVFSVDDVIGVDPATGKTIEFEPYFSVRHGRNPEQTRAFYRTGRRPSVRAGDRGTDVVLTTVDLGFNPRTASETNLIVRTTCTNRDRPRRLQQLDLRDVFHLEMAAPLRRIRCLRTPSSPWRPHGRRSAMWRLISHLSLNHLSISGGTDAEAADALKEILRLYDFSDPETSRAEARIITQLIDGIVGVRCRRAVARLANEDGLGDVVRGVEIQIDFDREKYIGTGVFLFACVLDRFLGLYATINSFTRLVANTIGTGEDSGVLKRFPPRAGVRPLV
ncbi:MAG: type VI secretion system baseplate subunit TssF [Alphaproteobacteria bacterium]|nr:type VI secretion system baseplate subunit TssF [Alphaproteobacteria bacterium]